MEIKTTAVFATAINDGALLMVFLLVGLILLQVIKPLQKLFLPAGLIGGAVALCTCQQKLDTKLKKSGIKNESMYKIHQLF